ncbi:MAG: sulfatase [Planctomycetota bacterium]
MNMKNAISISFVALIAVVAAVYFLWPSVEHTPSGVSPSITVLDLIQESRYADFVATTPVLNFGTERGRHHYHEADLRYHAACKGWYSFRDEERSQDGAMLLGGSGTFTLTVLEPEDGVLVLKGCAPEGGAGEAADLRLYLNDSLVGGEKLPRRLELHSLRFAIRAGDLLTGDNRFRVEVDGGISLSLPDLLFPVTLSAFFVSACLEPFSMPNPDAPLVVPDSDSAQPSSLVLSSGTRLDYYPLPEPGERLKGAVSVKGGPLKACIALTLPDRPAVDLFSRIITSDSGRIEFDLDLTPYAGQPCCLSLRSGLPGVVRGRSYLRWESLRVEKDSDRSDPGSSPSGEEASREDKTRAKPDMIVILLDAASSFFFESMGGRKAVTPSVDAFAKDAVVFSDTITPAPYTLPAVGSLMTGQVPDRHGVVWNANRDGVNMKLSAKTVTAASLLKAQGYSTYAVVTNPNAAALYGYGKGFDRYEELFQDRALWHEGVAPAPAVEKTKELIRKHKQENDSPFYLYLHLFQPHAPYTPPDAFVSQYTKPYAGRVDGGRAVIDGFKDLGEPLLLQEDFDHLRNLYTANLAYADDATGDLLDWIRAEGLYEDTLIVVCADHGEAFGEHHSIEHGHHLYEEALRVPLVIKYPGQRFAGVEVNEAVSLTDLPHTLAALGGADPASLGCDGIDLTSRLTGSYAWPDRALSARSDVYKPSLSLRWRGYQLICDTLSRSIELFFLPDDPKQSRNLIETDWIVAGYLRTRLCRDFDELAQTTKGERIQIDDSLIHAVQEIGYGGTANKTNRPAASDLCLPLGSR